MLSSAQHRQSSTAHGVMQEMLERLRVHVAGKDKVVKAIRELMASEDKDRLC